jgi:lipopolysaccharide assembly protein B
MQFESWWLLAVPVLFALGWMAARIDLTELLNESKQLPRSYFNGLNFLLNDQPDRAIEAFIEVVKLDPETIELHFALGSLFRRRGETERAIRIHRNLLERPDLPVAFRDQAMFSLAQDYLKAGLLDRAETAFKQLEQTPYQVRSLQSLSEIYQIESDWPRAIEAARQATSAANAKPRPGSAVAIATDTPSDTSPDQTLRSVAHYWCEIAQSALSRVDWQAASDAINEAKSADASLLRVAQLEISMAILKHDTAGALAMIHSTQAAMPAFAPLLVPLLLKAREPEPQRNADTLEKWFDQSPAESLALAAIAQWRAAGDTNAASAFAQAAVVRLPTLALSAAVLDQKISLSPDDAGLAALSKPIKVAVARDRRYECSNCGFRTTQFYWQCPGCKKWETFPYSGL